MSERARKLKNKASGLTAKGKLNKAMECYQEAKRHAPDDLYIRQKIAELFSRTGDIDSSIQEYQHLAGRYAADGMFLKAIAVNKIILSLDPNHKETQEVVADLYSRKRATEAATEVAFERSKSLPSSMSGAISFPESQAEAETEKEARKPPEELPDPEESVIFNIGMVEGTGLFPPLDDIVIEEASTFIEPTVVNASLLPTIPLFSELSSDELVALIERLELRWTKEGDRILEEGDSGTSMFVMAQGKVDILRGSSPTEEKVATLDEGSFFGEMALVSRAPRLATVVSAEDGLLLELDRKTLDELAEQHPSIRDVVVEHHTSRLIANLMGSSEIFGAFSEEAKRFFVERAEFSTVGAGTIIQTQNESGQRLFVVLRGCCRSVQTNPDCQESQLTEYEEGELFGVQSAMLDRACSSTVRAMTDCVLLSMSPEALKGLFTNHQEVLFSLDELVEARLSLSGSSPGGLV